MFHPFHSYFQKHRLYIGVHSDENIHKALEAIAKFGNLIATTEDSAYKSADIVVVDVPFDISFQETENKLQIASFEEAIRVPARQVPEGALIIIETTVPPGTCEKLIAPTLHEELSKRGIIVDRPDPINFNQKISTPDWEAETMFGCMPPRDVLLTVGNEILEATMSYRCRWFEYLCYRPLLKKYYNSDPNMRHESAPKPRLTDADYRKDYLSEKIGIQKRLEWTEKKFFVTTEEEPLFDAADILRFGKDLVVQHGFTTNLKGIDWIKRHYKDHRVHAVNFPGDPYPIHIDATFTPIKEGLIINNPQRKLPKEQRKLFEDNDWEIIDAAQPAHNSPPPLCYSSVWLSMNVLVLDSKTVCVEKSEVYQADQLDKLGMEVVPVELRDAYAFGGGLHCCTADVYREGKLKDYFPKQ